MRTIKIRLASVLAALVLLLSAVGIPAVRVAATEGGSGAYVLGFDDGRKPYLYGSRYQCKHSYNDPEAGENSVWTYWNAPEVFNLVYSDGETSRSVAAYCTDADTGTRANTYYRRINLEESDYHEAGTAGKLRAVILHTFPKLTVSEVSDAVNEALGEGTVQNLTQGELISATQQAIWEITHGDKYTVNDHYTSVRSMDHYDSSEFVCPESLENCLEGEYTASNIENLYNYFLSLDSADPLTPAVGECSIANVAYEAVKEEDGTYAVTASYEITASADGLILYAACQDQVQSGPLALGTGAVTFTGLNEPREVLLEIKGYQSGGDVYLFDAMGDRTVSQSMIGYDDSTLPVYAAAIASPDRILNIYKTSDDGDGTIPLANVQFEIYRVASMDQITTGEVRLSVKPTDDEIVAYQKQENLITTLVTDAGGYATYNLTENGCPDGVYLIVETENSAVTAPIAPFFAIIPGTNGEGNGHIYTINVYPKNTVETGPDVFKDVTHIDNDHDTFDVNEVHTWIIRGGVPAGIGDALRYEFRDTLDYRLTLMGNYKVKVGLSDDPAGMEAVTLTETTHFVVMASTAQDDEGNPVEAFTLSLTQEGRKAVAEAVGSNSAADFEVRVYFDAVINENAQMGTQIPNQAVLEYTNGMGVEYDCESDIPEVHTGGIHLMKVDSETEAPLEGATFRIARPATAQELADEQIEKEIITVDGEEMAVVFAQFYTDEALTEKADAYTTAADGSVTFYGLAYGTYYILETRAPAGYNLLTAPVAVEIHSQSHLEEETVTVVNTKFILPETGGMGTAMFTVAGAGLVGVAFVLLYPRRKRG